MKPIIHFTRPLVLVVLALASLTASTLAQEVSIPDPGLNAAVRDALQKPNGPLTAQDLLTLTNLDASRRNVKSTVGLEAARNLVSLNLQINQLTNFSIPTALTNLSVLDVSANSLTNLSVPNGLTKLTSLTAEGCSLTNLTLPATLIGLTNLDFEGNDLPAFNLSSNLTSLISLDLGFNLFTNFSLPGGLTNLTTFYFAGNPLTNVTMPPGLSGMTELNLSQNLLTSFTLPAGMTNLVELDLAFNQLTNLTLPADLRRLTDLDLNFNRLTVLNFPSNLTSLGFLHLRANLFTNFNLPAELSALTFLDLSTNQLTNITLPAGHKQLSILALSRNKFTNFTLPAGLTNLSALILGGNLLTNVVLPSDLSHLRSLDLGGNQLTSFTVPAGLTNLFGLFLTGNQLTNITLPPDLTQLGALGYLGNPLTTLVLSEPLAATNLAAELPTLQNQGVSVFTYPLAVQLVRPLPLAGAFKFGITGPPGAYAVYASTDLAPWSQIGITSNTLGAVNFVDVTSHLFPQRFYRALRQDPPANMVFIPPNTFIMGSPITEQQRSADEGPQTAVTLTRGFWIGKYEVTQGEYLSIMNTNPSEFPGDLSRPVSGVSWYDATNYCATLTQRELAAGRIPPGSHYRLPTEAEWECAARAGTTTRFSYGNDPDNSSLTNYAWYLDLSNVILTVRPVGQKLPNPWGLYDMHGNIWEWCQDWYGSLPGGVQIDPTGPPGPDQFGGKVMRGGAYDYPDSSCRSASRLFRFPLFPDSDLGFRVVLVTDPQ